MSESSGATFRSSGTSRATTSVGRRGVAFTLAVLTAVMTPACQNREPAGDPVWRIEPRADPGATTADPSARHQTLASESHVPTTAPAPSIDTAGPDARPITGRPCKVYLRRDAMGLTGAAPLPLHTASPAARAVEFDGTIELATDEWIVLRAKDRTYWLPTAVILAVEYATGP